MATLVCFADNDINLGYVACAQLCCLEPQAYATLPYRNQYVDYQLTLCMILTVHLRAQAASAFLLVEDYSLYTSKERKEMR